MEDLISAILQLVLEIIFEVILNIPFDWPTLRRDTPEADSITKRCFAYALMGGGVAAVSLLAFPHSLISWSSLRIANLILAPIVAASSSQRIAKWRAGTDTFIDPRTHYWQAFWFTLVFVAVRFAYIARS